MVFTVWNALFAAAFLLSAAVQYNDPDGLAWGAIYLAAAAMCAGHHLGRRRPWLPLTLLIASLGWLAALAPGVIGQLQWPDLVSSMQARKPAIELAREAGGLALVAFWAGILLCRQRLR